MELLALLVQDVECIREEMYLLWSAPEAEFFQGGVNSRLSASEAEEFIRAECISSK